MKMRGAVRRRRPYVRCFHECYRANSNSRRQSAGSRRSLRFVTQSSSPCCRGGYPYHADRGAGARSNSSARDAMSVSDADFGSKSTTARPAVACTFIEFGANLAQVTKQGVPSSGVKPLHTAAKIVTVPQEFRYSALHGCSRRWREAGSELTEPATQFWRYHHEAQAQRWA